MDNTIRQLDFPALLQHVFEQLEQFVCPVYSQSINRDCGHRSAVSCRMIQEKVYFFHDKLHNDILFWEMIDQIKTVLISLCDIAISVSLDWYQVSSCQ